MSSGTEITGVTGETGTRIIATRVENALAEREMITLAAKHGKGVDGVLIAVSFDTALPALRELMPVPLIDGITAATHQLEALIRMNLPKARIGSFALPGTRDLKGVDPAIGTALQDGTI